MKKTTLFLLLATQLCMAGSLHAVAYPFPKSRSVNPGEVSAIAGARLYLFHGGDKEAKGTINVDDVLVVYREYPHRLSLESTETGKVKILSTAGGDYYEAEVVAGTITPGELARKGAAACVITAFKKDGH